MKLNSKSFLLAIVLGTAVSSQAALIGVYNTGVNSSGTPLPGGTVGDPHYSLLTSPLGSYPLQVLTSANGYPVSPSGPWLGDDPTSAWIGPNLPQANGPAGPYVYRTTFDLTGLNYLTAMITGRWATDDQGVQVILNGINTGNSAAGFTVWSALNITTGFIPGVNTLDFLVNNGGGPTGLRVEMIGTADAISAVPEPATYIAGALLLLPFGARSLQVLRNRKSVA